MDPELGQAPPTPSRWLASDVRHFFLHRPAIPTFVDIQTPQNRRNYEQRIRQRTGISAEQYYVLNIHRIGIDAPASHVFEELLVWNRASTCWPNKVAAVERIDGSLEDIQFNLFGIRSLPLFSMRSLKLQRTPGGDGGDNARYLLYECGGGYPIGVFCLYVRSAIATMGETANTQFFLIVGFDFYGRQDWSQQHLIHRSWATIHNRVTSNVLNRFKQLCEWRFQQLQEGMPDL